MQPVTRRRPNMAQQAYDNENTALVVIDPYNDFISEGGKIWTASRRLQKQHCISHMLEVTRMQREKTCAYSMRCIDSYRPGGMTRPGNTSHPSRSLRGNQGVRVRDLGWRVPARVRASRRGEVVDHRTLVFQRVRQHGSGLYSSKSMASRSLSSSG